MAGLNCGEVGFIYESQESVKLLVLNSRYETKKQTKKPKKFKYPGRGIKKILF